MSNTENDGAKERGRIYHHVSARRELLETFLPMVVIVYVVTIPIVLWQWYAEGFSTAVSTLAAITGVLFIAFPIAVVLGLVVIGIGMAISGKILGWFYD